MQENDLVVVFPKDGEPRTTIVKAAYSKYIDVIYCQTISKHNTGNSYSKNRVKRCIKSYAK